MTLVPCISCGEPSDRSRCDTCRPDAERASRIDHAHRRPASAHARGYDAAWRNLSLRARRAQPWCSDCGSVHDLTADHTPAAWERKAKGLPIRLEDIDVVCRRCNTDRGAARGGRKHEHPGGSPPRKIAGTHSAGGIVCVSHGGKSPEGVG